MREIRHAVITGATGMIGAHLTRLLLEKGIKVTAVVRPGSRKLKNLPREREGLQILLADVSGISGLTLPEGERADAFFHLAWAGTEGSTRNDETAQDKNVAYTLDAVKKAKELGCSVFIGAGSQAEYGFYEGKLGQDTPLHPLTAYGKAKLAAEIKSREEAGKLGIAHIWPRILSVYGPWDNDYTLVSQAVRGFLNKEETAFTAGEQIWDYLYAGDCAAALYHLALSGEDGQAYPLGKGEEIPLKMYITAIRDAVDPSLPIGLGKRPYNEHQVMHLSADISALVRDTGYRPETPFYEGIRKTIQWIRRSEA